MYYVRFHGEPASKTLRWCFRIYTVDYLNADPALVYHLCDFYLRNPDLRDELSSGAALRRALA